MYDNNKIANILITPIIIECTKKLKDINEKLQEFKFLRVPYSSILIIYDVDKVDTLNLNLNKDLILTIKLIDFGFYKYLPESSETDPAIIFAIINLIQILDDLIDKNK